MRRKLEFLQHRETVKSLNNTYIYVTLISASHRKVWVCILLQAQSGCAVTDRTEIAYNLCTPTNYKMFLHSHEKIHKIFQWLYLHLLKAHMLDPSDLVKLCDRIQLQYASRYS